MSPRARFGIVVAILLAAYTLALLYASAVRAEPPKGTEVAAMSDRYIFRITSAPCTNAVILAELAKRIPEVRRDNPGIAALFPDVQLFMAGDMDYDGGTYASCWAELHHQNGTFVIQMADDKEWIRPLRRELFRSQGI